MKIAKRFYVGSATTILNGEWTHRTVEQAVKHAERLIADGESSEQFVVQVIRVVRRKDNPVIVEKVE